MKVIARFVFVTNLCAVLGEYDITTVYKFNTYEEADANGEILRTYIDTCDVSVHSQTNAAGLPFMSVKGDANYPESLIYPSKAPTIPELKEPYGNSHWRTLTSTGATEELEIKELSGALHSDVFYTSYPWSSLTQNPKVICNARHKVYSEYFQGVFYSFDKLFSSEDLLKLEGHKHTFLRVQVKLENSRDFQFRLKNKDSAHTLDVYTNTTIKVCDQPQTSCVNFYYEKNNEYQINLYVSIDGTLVIYDRNAKKYLSHGKTSLEALDYYDSIDQNYIPGSSYSRHYITYELVQFFQQSLSDNKTFVTPWLNIKNQLEFHTIYYRKANSNVQVFLRDKNGKKVLLESSEEILLTVPLNTADINEIILSKVEVEKLQNWTDEKQIEIKSNNYAYITNIWEISNEPYTIHEGTVCKKDENQEPYKVALKSKDNNNGSSGGAHFCLNGGQKSNSICICPPGFAGDSCEFPCGRNYFGRNCSQLCSETEDECKGMILCTPSFGCTCPPGYYGDKCLQECEEGTYGTDCNQTCGKCSGGCDRYSGECTGECDSPFMIWPSCKYPHSYWTSSPLLKDSGSTSITVSLDFDSKNIIRYPDETQFFMIQYKENTGTMWTNSSYEIFNLEGMPEYVIDDLKPGTLYLLRAVLIDKSFKTHDPELSKITEGKTQCIVSTIDNNINVTKITNTSITLFWNQEMSVSGNECPFSSYILDITQATDDFKEHRKVFNITGNRVVIKYLKPGKPYLIELKKDTVHGESPTISSITVNTETTIDNTLGVAGIVIQIKGSDIFLQWLKNPINKTYHIKYKLLNQLSCNNEGITKSPLQTVSTNSTNYTLTLEPNTEYEIFVSIDPNQITSFKKLIAITHGSLPSISPTFLIHRMKITNETLLAFWNDPSSSCTQMNGFFKKYRIQLFENQNTLVNTYHTSKKKIDIVQLTPKMNYKIRIWYVNHIGYNPHEYAEYVFSTKATSFLSPQNLTAYKTTANLVGLRWKMPESNTTITGIIIYFQNQSEKKSVNITDLNTLQCRAWPSHVCYTIQNLKHNSKYEVAIDIFSEEFPEGGSQKTISVVTRETMPSPVTEIKVNNTSLPNLALSWKIPYLLNGVLRKFQIEVEHLSSFDETMCCQGVSTINYIVKEEQEIYTHVLENILTASSYQVTIRAFTRRLGQEASKIIETPPPTLPMIQTPKVSVEGADIAWEVNEVSNKTSNRSDGMRELVTGVLVVVQPNDAFTEDPTQISLVTDLNNLLNSNNWWIAHVCEINTDCSVNIGTDEEKDSAYGKIRNKPLKAGYNYTIIAVQINKHLSAKSYTVVKSTSFVTKGEAYNTTDNPTNTTDDTYLKIDNDIVEDYLHSKNSAPTSENTLNGQEDTEPPIDYELEEI